MSKKDVLKGRSIVTKNIFDTANQTIEEIKRNNPLIDYFRSRGVEFTKSGSQFMGLCPFHDDRNPSLSLNIEKQLFNCFGCGKSGSVIDAVVYYENVTTGEAIKILSGNSSPSPSFRAAYKLKEKPVRRDAARNEAPSHERPGEKRKQKSDTADDTDPVSETAETADNTDNSNDKLETNITLTKITEYYHRKFYDNADALSYLKSRGITKPEIYERFKIGYAAGTLNEIIGTDQKDECVRIGILRENGKEHFQGYVTFPIIDDTGLVVGMYGRKISSPSTGNTGRGARGESIPHLYLKDSHRGVFNRKVSKVFDEIILTESIIDALSLIELDVQNVQPIYGVNGFTDEHLQILKDDRVKTITIAFDNDEAGKTASVNLKEKLLSEGFAVKVIEVLEIPNLFPEHPDSRPKDWNEYLVSGVSSTSRTDLSGKVKEALIKAEITALPEDTGSLKVTDEQGGYIFTISGVSYRISGVKEFFVNNLRVNIRAEIDGEKYFDNLDLYSARSRANYSLNLSKVFSIEPKKIEKDLIAILEYLEAERDRKLRGGDELKEEMTQEEIELGLSLLKDPKLFDRIVEDMDALGYVGEDLNKKLLYLAASSRILDDPISVLILSQSASGKSMLVDTVKKLIPPDEVIAVTSLSDQALNYFPSLMHKFLILGEAVHNDIIEHQIREMLSGKELSRLVTIKDEKTGKMSSREIKTPVIVSAVMSGTNHNINPENASRSFVVNTDESKEQTRRIHEAQRGKHTLERYYARSRLLPEIIRKHHAAQRLLKKIIVVNPFAEYLNFPDNLMRSRRDHDRLLDLIACVCFLRQYQKEILHDTSSITSGTFAEQSRSIEYIKCDITDYEIAYDIMVNGVLSSTMTEIPRGTIDLYNLICELAKKSAKSKDLEPSEVSFTQRDIREYTNLGQSWIKQHLRILLDYEYLIVIKGGTERSKGFYRIRALDSIQKLDLSMIPTPEQMKAFVPGAER